MRITFLTPPPSMAGGIRVISIHAEGLRRRGHEVVLVYPPVTPTRFRRRVRALLRGEGWKRYRRQEPSYFDQIDVEQIRLEQPGPVMDDQVPEADVVVATWWETAEWAMGLSPAKGSEGVFHPGI